MWPQPFVQSGLRLLSCALCYLPSQSHLYFSPQQTVGQMVPRTQKHVGPSSFTFSEAFFLKIKYNGNQIWADLSCSCSPASPVAGSGQWVTWMHMHGHKPPPHCRSAPFLCPSLTLMPCQQLFTYFISIDATMPTFILLYCQKKITFLLPLLLQACSHRVLTWLHFKKEKKRVATWRDAGRPHENCWHLAPTWWSKQNIMPKTAWPRSNRIHVSTGGGGGGLSNLV